MDFMMNMTIPAHKWMKFMRCKGPHKHFENVHLCTGIDLAWSPFSKVGFYGKFGFTKNRLLFPSVFYKNSYFENTLFENSDRKSKEKDKEEDHCSDKDKINHLFYPLGILQKVLAELRKDSTAIYFSRKLMLESRQIVVREFCKDSFSKMLCLRILIGK